MAEKIVGVVMFLCICKFLLHHDICFWDSNVSHKSGKKDSSLFLQVCDHSHSIWNVGSL